MSGAAVRRRASLRGSFLEELFRATEEGPPGKSTLSTWALMRNETQTVAVSTHEVTTTLTTAAPAEPAVTVAPSGSQ
jgi:hypothetical protein